MGVLECDTVTGMYIIVFEICCHATLLPSLVRERGGVRGKEVRRILPYILRDKAFTRYFVTSHNNEVTRLHVYICCVASSSVAVRSPYVHVLVFNCSESTCISEEINGTTKLNIIIIHVCN